MIRINPILPWPLLLAWVVIGAWWNLRLYQRTLPATRYKFSVQTLRLVLWAFLFALTLRPVIRTTVQAEEKSRLYLVRDVSDSMQIQDMPASQTRAEAVTRKLQESETRKLASAYDLIRLEMGRTCAPAVMPADRHSTAIGDALSHIAAQSSGRRVNSILLLSDGRNNSGHSLRAVAEKLKQRKIPVHCVLVGNTQFGKNWSDALLTDLRCPPTIAPENNLPVLVQGIWRGLAGHPCQIEFIIDGQTKKKEILTPEQKETPFSQRFDLPLNGLAAGFHRLDVQLHGNRHEVTPANNQMRTFFKIRKSGIQVLYLEGVIRPEFKFLRRFLERLQGFDVTIKSPFWLQSAAGKKFLQSLQLRKYEVFLIGDIWRPMLADHQWDAIRRIVRNRGAGLLVLGGTLNLDPFFWRQNPLYICLPARIGTGTPKTEPFTIRPAAGKENHFLCAPFLTKNGNQAAPLPVQGLRTAGLQPRPFGSVLLQDEKQRPILCTGEYFLGRTAVMGTDCTWNWITANGDAGRKLYRQFWTRMLYYLAKKEENLNTILSISTDRTRYQLGNRILITGDILDKNNRPVLNARINLQIRDLDSNNIREVVFTQQDDRYTATIRPDRAGDYSLRATTLINQQKTSSNELRLHLFAERKENREILANPVLMKDLAARTGGQFLMLPELNRLLAKLAKNTDRLTVRRTLSETPLWDKWWILALGILLFSSEWTLRRKMGLP